MLAYLDWSRRFSQQRTSAIHPGLLAGTGRSDSVGAAERAGPSDGGLGSLAGNPAVRATALNDSFVDQPQAHTPSPPFDYWTLALPRNTFQRHAEALLQAAIDSTSSPPLPSSFAAVLASDASRA